MKILHLISSGGMYGAEAVILNLSQALIAAGDASEIALFDNRSLPNYELERAASERRIVTHRIPCRGQFDRTVPRHIRELAASTEADVVHAHGYKADIYAWVARRQLSAALVSTCHNWIDNSLLLRGYGRLDRFALRSFAAVTAVSADVRDRLLRAGVPQDRITLIANGIETERFQQHRTDAREPGQPLTVGVVGRLSHEKGVDLFLQAAAQVAQQLPQTQFVVFGEGPERQTLEDLVRTLGLASQVSLPGRRDDMPAVYASLDVLVSPSRQEGLPMSLLEAMASSLPIVATSVGEVPSLILHEATGLLVPPDDPQALASAMMTLLTNPALRHRLGTQALRHVEAEFSASRMAETYRGLYRGLLAAPRPDRTVHA